MKYLCCLGDSNTWGYDPRSFLGSRYPKNIRWTGRLEQLGYSVENDGMNGACIPSDGASAASWVEKQGRVDLCIVMYGSNDLLNGCSAEEAGIRMEQFLSEFCRCSSVPVLLLAPVPMKPGEWVQGDAVITASEQLRDCYRRAAEKTGVYFADAGEWQVELGYDGVHFSEAGHYAFAEGLSRVLQQIPG